jgi:hypothetical protein
MSYNITPTSGINLDDVVQSYTQVIGATTVTVPANGPAGAQVWASDGRRYVLARAGAAITASTATCSINASTFVATPSAGAYLSPAVAVASGDFAWFSATSV